MVCVGVAIVAYLKDPFLMYDKIQANNSVCVRVK